MYFKFIYCLNIISNFAVQINLVVVVVDVINKITVVYLVFQ